LPHASQAGWNSTSHERFATGDNVIDLGRQPAYGLSLQ